MGIFKMFIFVLAMSFSIIGHTEEITSGVKSTGHSKSSNPGYLLLTQIPQSQLDKLELEFEKENSIPANTLFYFNTYSGKLNGFKNNDLLWGNKLPNDQPTCLQAAKNFIDKNKDKLGVPKDELQWLEFTWDDQGTTLTATRPTQYYPGVNTFDNAPEYTINLIFEFNGNQLGGFSDQTDYMPMGFDPAQIEEQISVVPRVYPLSKKMAQILGKTELTFSDGAGSEVSVGFVKGNDVVGIQRKIQQFSKGNQLYIGLVWEITVIKAVGKEGMTYEFNVWMSAITGEVLMIQPKSST